MKKFWVDLKFVLPWFLLWRVGLFLIGLPGFRLLTFKASFPYIDERLIASGFPQWIWQWGNFDGVHYLTIASQGYLGLVSSEQVFFPLYPALVRLPSLFFGNFFFWGLVVSNLSFLLASAVFFQIVKREFGRKTAVWSLAFLFLFPTSFYFAAVYTEPLFLLLVLLTFLFDGPVSALTSFAAGTTRLVGAFLGIAGLLSRKFVLLAGLLGTAAYSLFLYLNFGNPILYLAGQGAFKNARANSLSTLVSPPQVIFRYLKIFLNASPTHYDFWVAVLEFGAFWLGIGVLAVLTWRRKVPSGWLIFSWLSLLLPVFSGTLSSMPRYLLSAFPIFIGLGLIRNVRVKVGILALSGLLLAILTVLFTRGYWVA